MTIFLHDTPDFRDLIEVLAGQMGIDPSLVEKDSAIAGTRACVSGDGRST